MLPNPPDGWHSVFNLSAAAKICEKSVPELRTRIARGLLTCVGENPGRGAEREFSVLGIYQIALNDAAERLGMDQLPASQAIRELFKFDSMWSALAPEHWIKESPLFKRDLSHPQILVIAVLDDHPRPLTRIADGWEKLPKKIIDFQYDLRTLKRATPEEFRKFSEQTKAGVKRLLPDDHPDVQSGVDGFIILNLTAVLTRIDERIFAYYESHPKRLISAKPKSDDAAEVRPS